MNKVFLVFPHQLFKNISLLKDAKRIILIEEFLFFKQYNFHKQKLVLHRATMKYYESFLKNHSLPVEYIESDKKESDVRVLISSLLESGIEQIEYYEVCDQWLEQRISRFSAQYDIKKITHCSPSFINSEENLHEYFKDKKRLFHADFYIHQRNKLNILIDNNNNPIGGKWSFDSENRLKYPKDKKAPVVTFPAINIYYKEAIAYVEKKFANNIGYVSHNFIYPTTHSESEVWLQNFLENRFEDFGKYEDAIVQDESILNHSVLTPMLNIGLLTPHEIVDATLKFSEIRNILLNSTEGFIRQIIGWREFIRAVYIHKGTFERNKNFWGFSKKIPASFYDGTTGIDPIDSTIKKILTTGYCHHIERLMLLGNFMLLCEFDPDEVYKWFMEMFIDAYDWVMVPNVYGMSQFADGGLMATKPYISGSSYVLKMSNYKKANWCEVWDALFWNFMNKHRKSISRNPRMAMLLKTYDKMSEEKKEFISNKASTFLKEFKV